MLPLFNTVFVNSLHSLVGSNGTMSTRASCQDIYAARQWGKLPALYPADEYTVSLILLLKQIYKACSPLDCQKEAELNHSSLDLFCANFVFVLSTVALYCHYQGHKWVRNWTEKCYHFIFSLYLKRFFEGLFAWSVGCWWWLRRCLRLFFCTEM